MYDKLRKIRQSRAEDDRGFTLIELLVVVVIIGILIAIAIPLYLNYQKGAHDKAAQSDLKSAVATLQQCYTENSNAYPSATDDYTITQGTSIVFTCGTETETANLSDGTNVSYASTDGTSFTLKAWNTGGHKNTEEKAYSYDSTDGGKIE